MRTNTSILKAPLLWLLAIFLLLPAAMQADPVKWSVSVKGAGTESPALVITAKVDAGYHLYAPSNPQPGGVPLSFRFDALKGATLVGKPVADRKYTKAYSDIFEQDEHYFSGTVTFTQKLKPTADKFSVKVEANGQVCNDGGCWPVHHQQDVSGTAKAAAEAVSEVGKKEDAEQKESAMTDMADSLNVSETLLPEQNGTDVEAYKSSYWQNVESEFKQFGADPGTQGRSLLYIFIAGFLGGLLALVTPCVWPMIPMTVSFFLKKKDGGRKRAVGQAAIYGLGIIVIYVGLGLIITAIFGASALNNLATSAIFNIIFFALLVLFAISFMGGFELTLPASWTNKMDAKVDSCRSSSWPSRWCSCRSAAPAPSSAPCWLRPPPPATSSALLSVCSASRWPWLCPSPSSPSSHRCSSPCPSRAAGSTPSRSCSASSSWPWRSSSSA